MICFHRFAVVELPFIILKMHAKKIGGEMINRKSDKTYSIDEVDAFLERNTVYKKAQEYQSCAFWCTLR